MRSTFNALQARFPAIVGPIRRVLLRGLHKYNRVRYAPAENVLDNLSTVVVADVCVSVPEFNGQFFIDARSALFRRIARDGYYEPGLTELCARYIKPGADVLDIGANIGFHSVYFAQLVAGGRVLAVEPTSNALARLKRNIEHNQVEQNIIVHHGAVSDSDAMLEIKVIAGREEFSTLGNMTHQAVDGEQWSTEQVQCMTLDALVKHYQLTPAFIKMDVEGVENLVFKGASQTLQQYRPIILAELSDVMLKKNGSSAQAVLDLLEQADYQVFDANQPDKVSSGADYGEILCLPR